MATNIVELDSVWNSNSMKENNKRGKENSTKEILMVRGDYTGSLIITLILDLCSESIKTDPGSSGNLRNKDSQTGPDTCARVRGYQANALLKK